MEKQDAGEDIGNNYLMPSVTPKDVKTTEYSDEANKTIAYRNYMFTAYKKKGENNKYILCFKRVITGKTSKTVLISACQQNCVVETRLQPTIRR